MSLRNDILVWNEVTRNAEMNDSSRHIAALPLKQKPPRDDRVRPTNPFTEFKKEEIEQ